MISWGRKSGCKQEGDFLPRFDLMYSMGTQVNVEDSQGYTHSLVGQSCCWDRIWVIIQELHMCQAGEEWRIFINQRDFEGNFIVIIFKMHLSKTVRFIPKFKFHSCSDIWICVYIPDLWIISNNVTTVQQLYSFILQCSYAWKCQGGFEVYDVGTTSIGG